MRSFNTAGPVKPDRHYCIPPLSRIDPDAVLCVVGDEKYFVLHAPRQTGKTSALLTLADVLNGRGYRCVYVTVETARTARDDVQRAMRVVLATLAEAAHAAARGFDTLRRGTARGQNGNGSPRSPTTATACSGNQARRPSARAT